MKIVGFNITKISVERNEVLKGKIEIKQNIHIDKIEKDKIESTKDEVLKIKFKFQVDYDPKLAKLEFEGILVILPDKDEMKMFLKEWKNKKVPEGIKAPLFNFIMGKCNVKALSLEDEMGLPLHIPMPKIAPKNE